MLVAQQCSSVVRTSVDIFDIIFRVGIISNISTIHIMDSQLRLYKRSKGTISFSKSTKSMFDKVVIHNLNSGSSTEADLIGVDDVLPTFIW